MPDAEKLRVYRDVVSGGYRWVLRSAGGERLAESEGGVPSREDCLALARSVLEDYPSAELQDLTSPGGPAEETGA